MSNLARKSGAGSTMRGFIAAALCGAVACAEGSKPASPSPVRAVAGPPAHLVPKHVPASAPVVSLPAIVAQVTDSVGVGVPGATVTWSVIVGSGSLAPVTSVADENGTVGTSLQLPVLPELLRVRGTVGTSVAQDFDIDVVPGPLYQLTPVYTDLALRVDSAFSATVRAVDLYGNGIPGITLSSRAGDVAFTNLTTQPTVPLVQTTDADGNATFRGTVGMLPGLQSFYIEAAVSSRPPYTFNASFRVRATGDGGYIAPSSGQADTLTLGAGATVNVAVAVIQADGFPAAQAPVNFSLAAGNGSIVSASGNGTSSSSATTDNTGGATVKWHLPGAAGTYSISATTPAPNDGRSPLVITAVVH